MILFVGQVDTRVIAAARPSRKSTTARCSAARQMGRPKSTTSSAFRNSSRARSVSRRPVDPGRSWSALPEDVLDGSAVVADAPARRIGQIGSGAGGDRRGLADCSRRPNARWSIVGGAGWNGDACRAFAAFAHAWNLPVACVVSAPGPARQSRPPLRRPAGPGRRPAACRARAAGRPPDGGRLPAGRHRPPPVSTLVESPLPGADADPHPCRPRGTGPGLRRRLPINAGMPATAAALAGLSPPDNRGWRAWTRVARAEYEAHATPPRPIPRSQGVDSPPW